jgi:hypothetical protein
MSLALNECLISPRGLDFDEFLKKSKQVWVIQKFTPTQCNLHQHHAHVALVPSPVKDF